MKVKPLLKSINSSNFLSQYLQALGIQEVDKYLNADLSVCDSPWLYSNMQEGVERLHTAISCGEQIGILQDVDSDGVMSATIAYDFLKKQGIQPTVFWHTGKQHGIGPSKDEDMLQQIIDSGITLLWIPDAGSGDVNPCKELKKLGIDTIITDHHLAKENPYAIVINCHFGEGLNSNLTGAGVTDKFIEGYYEKYGTERPDYSDLVAFSLISDVADLTSLENRAYIVKAQEQNNDFLVYMSSKLGRGEKFTPHNISWNLSPKINAVQRSDDMDAKRMLFMAFVGEADKDEALSIASKLHREQTKKTRAIYEEIDKNIDNSHKVVVCFGDTEDKNYLGLVANKIMGNYGKPVIILREANSTTWTGSLRSPVPVAEQINQSKLAQCQGHSTACGITIKKSNLNRLIKWFDTLPLDIDPEQKVAAILKPNQITLPLCHACSDDMVLWGASEGNKIVQPKFYLEFETSPSDVQVFVKKTTTVKITKDGVSFLKFQCDDKTAQLLQKERCKVAMIVTLGVNEWNGVESPQAIIDTWEIEKIEEDGFNFDDLF